MRTIAMSIFVAGLLCMPAAVAEEEITVTGYIPVPRMIADEIQANDLWDYNEGTLSPSPHDPTADFFLDPADPQGAFGVSLRMGGNLWSNGSRLYLTGTTAGATNAWLLSGPDDTLAAAGGDNVIGWNITPTFAGREVYFMGDTRIGGTGAGESGVGDKTLHVTGRVGIGDAPTANNLLAMGGNLINNTPPRQPAGSVQLRMSQGHQVVAEDYWVDSIGKWVSELACGDSSEPCSDDDWRRVHNGQDMYNLNPRTVGVGTVAGMDTSYKFHVNGRTRLQGNTQVDGVLTINGAAPELLNVGGGARVNGPLTTGNIELNGNLDAGGYLSGSSIAPNPTQCQWVNAGRCPGGKLIMQIDFNSNPERYECCRPTDND